MGMEKHKHALLCEFIHHGEKLLKMGCVFPQTILHSKQQPCLHWKIPQYVKTTGGQLGMSQETARRYLEKQVPVLSRLKKGNYTHSRYQSEIQKILQKNKTKPTKQKKQTRQIAVFLIFQKSWMLPTSKTKR